MLVNVYRLGYINILVNIYEIGYNVMNGRSKDDKYTKTIAKLTFYLPTSADALYLNGSV